MSGLFTKAILGGVVTAVAARCVEWVLICNCSYNDQNFLQRSELAGVWNIINLPSYIVGASFGPNSHMPDPVATEIAFFVQWVSIGTLTILMIGGIMRLIRIGVKAK